MRQVNNSSHFGVPVSHVSQRWRNLALATPALRTKIWCTRIKSANEVRRLPARERAKDSESSRENNRTATFLSMTRTLLLDISIIPFRREDFSPEFLELLGEHMRRCRQLRIKAADFDGMATALGYLSTISAPRLSSIDLKVDGHA